MRVGFWGLVAWAFLMATGHGAGLMLLPFLLPLGAKSMPNRCTCREMPIVWTHTVSLGLWLGAVAVHTFGYLLTMTLVAIVVYDRLGLQILTNRMVEFRPRVGSCAHH